MPQVQSGEQAAGARRAVASVSEVPNSTPDWPSGITMEPFFSVSSMATSPPCGGLAGDLPIPAGLGEVAVGEVGVPDCAADGNG